MKDKQPLIKTREKIKELIARRQARQWMKRIDRDLQEIRDTRSIIQTKIINIEATLEGKWQELLIILTENSRLNRQKLEPGKNGAFAG